MALPKAIQAQLEEAERIQQSLIGDVTGDPETPTPEVPVDPEPQPEVIASPEPEVPVVPQVPDEKWEHKYHTLKGMFDAEVPRLRTQLKEMNATVQALIAENAQLKVAPPAPAVPEQSDLFITDSDKEAFGTDLTGLIERAVQAAESKMARREQQLLDKIAKLEGAVGNVGQRTELTAKEQFFSNLTKAVPDWEVLNNDPAFIGWLAEADPVYGVARQAAVDAAFESLDSTRMASIFNSYKALFSTKAPAQAKPSDGLRAQVAPTRSRSTPAPAADTAQGRIWSEKEIGEFYALKRRGHLTDAEAARIEAEIDLAVAEGRVSR